MTAGDYDALIIGAGPAGSTAAILLAAGGWKVALIERQDFPRRKVCGECIAATNLPLLDALGVGAQFRALAGAELRTVALLCGSERACAPMPPAPDVADAWGRALGREHLDTLLLARARALGVQIWQPWVAGPLRGVPGAFRCELRGVLPDGADPEDAAGPVTLTAAVAIHAHGSWPARASRTRARDLLAFKANYAGVRLSPGVLPVLCFPGGYGGMVIADHGIMTLACCIRADQLRACRQACAGERAGSVIEHYLQSECHGVRDALTGARRLGPWLAVGPIRPGVRLRERPHLPAAFQIGNAAGEAHPLIGEGISMALQSAWLLATQLLACPEARRSDPRAAAVQASVHLGYVRAWRRQFLPRMRHAAWLAQLAMRPKLMRGLLPLLQRWPQLLTQSARWSGKIQCATLPAVIGSAGTRPSFLPNVHWP